MNACFFVIQNDRYKHEKYCKLYSKIDLNSYESSIGFNNKHLIADINLYQSSAEIEGKSTYVWRNGLKHDASKVMEFTKKTTIYLMGTVKRLILKMILFTLY